MKPLLILLLVMRMSAYAQTNDDLPINEFKVIGSPFQNWTFAATTLH